MKKISILIPCYNEEDNVVPITKAIEEEFSKSLPSYDYEICFIDNCSTDNTRPLLESLCMRDNRVKCIFNVRNFGQFNSPYYGLTQMTGDCVILLCCDFQDPIELLPTMVKEWEKGAAIVSCIKTTSLENRFVRFLRTIYYKTVKKMSDVEQIEHFTGFGLYDRSFVEVLRNLKDPTPFLRGIVAELGFRRVELPYQQAKRKAGRTHNNWYTLYDAAMLSFTSYTKVGLRLASFLGFWIGLGSFGVSVFYLVRKLMNWNQMAMGMAPLVIGFFFVMGLQLFFIGFLGEYIMSINQRIMNRPLVIEEKRIGWDRSSERDLQTNPSEALSTNQEAQYAN